MVFPKGDYGKSEGVRIRPRNSAATEARDLRHPAGGSTFADESAIAGTVVYYLPLVLNGNPGKAVIEASGHFVVTSEAP